MFRSELKKWSKVNLELFVLQVKGICWSRRYFYLLQWLNGEKFVAKVITLMLIHRITNCDDGTVFLLN